jgi:hypothetical protein
MSCLKLIVLAAANVFAGSAAREGNMYFLLEPFAQSQPRSARRDTDLFLISSAKRTFVKSLNICEGTIYLALVNAYICEGNLYLLLEPFAQ